MEKAHETPNIVQCCVGDEVLGHMLPHLTEQLDLCQKSLTGCVELDVACLSKKKKFLVFFVHAGKFFVSQWILRGVWGVERMWEMCKFCSTCFNQVPGGKASGVPSVLLRVRPDSSRDSWSGQ